MAYQAVFKRYEQKYILTRAQGQKLERLLTQYLIPDPYGRSTLRNLYFDTRDYRLIRRSMEKPVYKEKLRLRSYGEAAPGSRVYVELKKKYRGVVYKRRLELTEKESLEWLSGKGCPREGQIGREIDYFLRFYGPLQPAMFLSYERIAYYGREDPDFRLTIDDRLLARCRELTLEGEIWGTPLLEPDLLLMEIKCAGGMPLWLTSFLAREKLYKTSFSKYGAAYALLIRPNMKGESFYA